MTRERGGGRGGVVAVQRTCAEDLSRRRRSSWDAPVAGVRGRGVAAGAATVGAPEAPAGSRAQRTIYARPGRALHGGSSVATRGAAAMRHQIRHPEPAAPDPVAAGAARGRCPPASPHPSIAAASAVSRTPPTACGQSFRMVGSHHLKHGCHRCHRCHRCEVDGWCGGVFAVGASGGGGPFEDPTGVLSDSPWCELLHGVVALTQVREVPEGGGSALGVVDGVVDFAADRGVAAAGEAAVLVAGAEVAALGPGVR
jgi:hypothetical protein